MSNMFGIHLATGLGCVVAWQRRNGMAMGGLEQDIGRDLGVGQALVQQWKNKQLPVDPKHVEYLIIRCKRQGRMDRGWAEDLLDAYDKHPNPAGFVDEIYGQTDAEFTRLSNMAKYSDQFKTVSGRPLRDKGTLEDHYPMKSRIQIQIKVEGEARRKFAAPG